MVSLDKWDVGGSLDKVMDVNGYAILFELYDVKWNMVVALLAFNVVMVSIHGLINGVNGKICWHVLLN
jgi:hypothetical protein